MKFLRHNNLRRLRCPVQTLLTCVIAVAVAVAVAVAGVRGRTAAGTRDPLSQEPA